jgi:hypothetical protein
MPLPEAVNFTHSKGAGLGNSDPAPWRPLSEQVLSSLVTKLGGRF